MIDKLKYEYVNITNIVKKLNIFINDYEILEIVRTSSKKGTYIIENIKTKEKLFMKVKLRAFISGNELLIYKKIKSNPHKYVNNVNKIYMSDKLLIIMSEYIDGYDMSENKYYQLYLSNIENIFKQTLEGLKHIHSLGIIHCDIKPANIMIVNKSENQFVPIIIDFDFSRLNYDHENIKTYGSIGFVPPEILCGKVNKKSDIWSLAMTFCYVFFYNDLKFFEINYESSSTSSFSLDDNIIEKYDGEHKNMIYIIKKMLEHDENTRPEIHNILSFIKN